MYVGAQHCYALRIVHVCVKKASYGPKNFTCPQKTVTIPDVINDGDRRVLQERRGELHVMIGSVPGSEVLDLWFRARFSVPAFAGAWFLTRFRFRTDPCGTMPRANHSTSPHVLFMGTVNQTETLHLSTRASRHVISVAQAPCCHLGSRATGYAARSSVSFPRPPTPP